MDATTLADLKTEINNYYTFISTYNKGVADFLSGNSIVCPHFLDNISILKNDISASVVFSNVSSGQGSSYGAVADFVYEVAGIQRNISILQASKVSYYTEYSSLQPLEDSYLKGEVARSVAYITGKSPDQGIII